MLAPKLICVLIAERGAADFVISTLLDLSKEQNRYRLRIYVPLLVYNFLTKSHGQLISDAEIKVYDSELKKSQIAEISDAHCLLSSATSKKAELQFSTIAKVDAIPIVHVVDAFYGYRKRMLFLGKVYHFEKIIVIDDEAKKEAVAEGLPPESMVSLGHPGWEAISKNKLIAVGQKNKLTRNTIFFGAPIKRDYKNTLGFCEDDAWSLLVGSWKFFPDLFENVIYCPHPQQTEIPQLHGAELVEYNPDLFINFNQIFGIFSAPLIHAALLGCISISLQPVKNKKDVCAFSRRGFVWRATTSEEIRVLLEKSSMLNCGQLLKELDGSSSRLQKLIEEHAVNKCISAEQNV